MTVRDEAKQLEGTETSSSNASLNWGSVIWVILALLAASIEPIIVKMGYRAAASTLQLIFIKSIVGGLLILPVTRSFQLLPMRDIKRLFVASLLFMAITALIFLSLVYLSAIEVITITTTTPALVALVNQRKGRDILTWKFWTGFIFCFAGVLLTVEVYKAGSVSLSLLGLGCAFASVIGSTLYRTRMDDITADVKPLTASTYLFIMNALLAFLLLPWLGTIPKQAWPLGIWMGFAGAVANVAFLVALHLLGSTRISIFGMLQRPLVIIATAFILKESLSLWQILGIILVLVGIQMAKVQKAAEPETEKKTGAKNETEAETGTDP